MQFNLRLFISCHDDAELMATAKTSKSNIISYKSKTHLIVSNKIKAIAFINNLTVDLQSDETNVDCQICFENISAFHNAIQTLREDNWFICSDKGT